MSISAKDVMTLRKKTGLGMMDCKKALIEVDGDPVKAEEYLIQKLKGKMDTRTERPMAEGRLAFALKDDRSAIAIVELNTETDFTARNDAVVEATEKLVAMVLAGPEGETPVTDEITKMIDDIRISTGENTTMKRGIKFTGTFCGSYLHHDYKKGSIITLDGVIDNDLARGICQHITAIVPPPVALDGDSVPAEIIEQVKADARKDALEEGKPENIVDKIVEGRVRKYLSESTLVNQKYLPDPEGKATVGGMLPEGVKITMFKRVFLGID